MPSGEPPRRRVSAGSRARLYGEGNVEGVASGWEGGAKKDGCADRRARGARGPTTRDGRWGHHPDAPSMRRFSAATVSLGLHRRRRVRPVTSERFPR